jgi:hypothetical protein
MASFLQFKRTTSATVMETFTVDGAPINLDSGVPTVTITKPDGTTIASGTVSGAWAGPPARSTGQYRFVLAGQPECTLLDVTWTGTIGGQPQTLQSTIEIVGADLFTLGELRDLRVAGGTPFSEDSDWNNARLMDARAATLDEFEQILGFSPVPRYVREVHSVGYGQTLLLRQLLASRLLSVTVNGTAAQVGGFLVDGTEVLPVSGYSPSVWSGYGVGNVVVEYVAGWPRVMGDGGNVAMLRAAMRLQPGLGSTASTVSTPDGTVYSYDPAGQVTQAGTVRHFGIPAMDSWLNRWQQSSPAVA